MEKNKSKGLADNQDGEFVLNESGTSVTIDADVDFPEDKEPNDTGQENDGDIQVKSENIKS